VARSRRHSSFLEVDGAVDARQKKEKRLFALPQRPWQPDTARFEQVTRFAAGWKSSRCAATLSTKGCLMEFLAAGRWTIRRQRRCGKCMNCTKHTERQTVARITHASRGGFFCAANAARGSNRACAGPKPLLEEIQSAVPGRPWSSATRGALKNNHSGEKLRAAGRTRPLPLG